MHIIGYILLGSIALAAKPLLKVAAASDSWKVQVFVAVLVGVALTLSFAPF